MLFLFCPLNNLRGGEDMIMPIDMVQKFIVEVDSKELLEQYLRLAIKTVLIPHDELAVKVVHIKDYLPSVLMDQYTRFPIIFISGWCLPENGENSYFNGYGPWRTFRFDETTNAVESAIQYVKELLEKQGKTWATSFFHKFGDGHTDWFDENDGTVGFGYELRACGGLPEWLAISIIHVYYGK